MKLKKINYFYDDVCVNFYLRWYEHALNKVIFNDRIWINKHCKPLRARVYNSYPIIFPFKIYKNMNLNFIKLRYDKFKGPYYDVALSII